MMSLDDLMADLFAAIEAIPDAPDLEQIGPADVAALGSALQIAEDQLGARSRLFNSNARLMLPEWEHPHEAP